MRPLAPITPVPTLDLVLVLVLSLLYSIFTEIAEDLVPKVHALINRGGNTTSQDSGAKAAHATSISNMLNLAWLVDRPVLRMLQWSLDFIKGRG